MKTVTMEEAQQQLYSLLALVAEGETVAIQRHDQVVAQITRPIKESRLMQHPDYLGRMKKIFGDRVLPDSQPIFDDMRQDAGSPERRAEEIQLPPRP